MLLVKILDVLLYPEGFYKRLTNKKFSLIIGMIVVGIIDLGFPLYFNSGKAFNSIFNKIAFNILQFHFFANSFEQII